MHALMASPPQPSKAGLKAALMHVEHAMQLHNLPSLAVKGADRYTASRGAVQSKSGHTLAKR